MDQGIVGSIFTVIVFVSFIGVVWWAFSSRNKKKFDEAANLVFADEEKEKSKEDQQESRTHEYVLDNLDFSDNPRVNHWLLLPSSLVPFVAGESVWEHPFLWGSKRTGPDLARVGGRYSDEWHRVHLLNPRNVVPESNMPGFPWLAENTLNGELTAEKMEVFRGFGVPYTDEDIAGAKAAVQGKTEMQALIAYLQSLGTHLK